jgi:hypothetical protein
MAVLFARTRWHYQPYDDLFRLAELSEYPVVYLDEVDWQCGDTVIASPHNGEWFGIPERKKTRLIWFNIERAEPSTDYSKGGKDKPSNVDEVWVADRYLAKLTGAKYVFMGGDARLGGNPSLTKDFDVITLMAFFGRRMNLWSDLRVLRLADDPDGLWGAERHRRMRKSHLLVSAHQDGYQYIEPPRFMLAGVYGLPLVTETVLDGGYYEQGIHYLSTYIEGLRDLAVRLMDDPQRMALMGRALKQLVCVEHPFKKEIEGAL